MESNRKTTLETPLVLIIFNRPELTEKLFRVVQKIKPRELFIISDGPRNKKEAFLVEKTRNIIEQINWKCTIYRKYSSQNLGCRKSVSSGLDWVFSKTARAIILEDDCVPDLSFFPYCEELLEQYKDEKGVMMISGDNFFKPQMNSSYAFARHSLIWGWATWKRAWSEYRKSEDKGISYFRKHYTGLRENMNARRLNSIKKTLEGKIDTWDYIWQFALLVNKGLCIYPAVNLVQNIGFGKDAIHTKIKTFHSTLTHLPIQFPLKHPKRIEANIEFDTAMEKTYHPMFSILDAIMQFFR